MNSERKTKRKKAKSSTNYILSLRHRAQPKISPPHILPAFAPYLAPHRPTHPCSGRCRLPAHPVSYRWISARATDRSDIPVPVVYRCANNALRVLARGWYYTFLPFTLPLADLSQGIARKPLLGLVSFPALRYRRQNKPPCFTLILTVSATISLLVRWVWYKQGLR